MSDPDDDLRRRRAALDRRLGPAERAEAKRSNPAKSDLARGLKLSSEFIAGVVVGALIGYLFDLFLGTSPFGLIVFLLIGFAAGVLNVMRETGAMAKAETRIGPRRAARADPAASPSAAPMPEGATGARGGGTPREGGTAREDGPGAGDPAMYDDD